jgi:hypothetical protein
VELTYDPSDALIDGSIYYAAQLGTNGCEGALRLAIKPFKLKLVFQPPTA